MTELELEKTYLLKALPADLVECRSEVIKDYYVPGKGFHPVLRLRQRGDRYEITKKLPVSGLDSSRQNEYTIELTKDEFDDLSKDQPRLYWKTRYYCQISGRNAEVDVCMGKLDGLALVDFEFDNDEDMEAFEMPEICLADVTQEVTFAGGYLAGKEYLEIKTVLDKYGYKPLMGGAKS